VLYILIFTFFNGKRRQKVLEFMVASIIRI
jgi:hypothetical protein